MCAHQIKAGLGSKKISWHEFHVVGNQQEPACMHQAILWCTEWDVTNATRRCCHAMSSGISLFALKRHKIYYTCLYWNFLVECLEKMFVSCNDFCFVYVRKWNIYLRTKVHIHMCFMCRCVCECVHVCVHAPCACRCLCMHTSLPKFIHTYELMLTSKLTHARQLTYVEKKKVPTDIHLHTIDPHTHTHTYTHTYTH